jgi:hypothetical protein
MYCNKGIMGNESSEKAVRGEIEIMEQTEPIYTDRYRLTSTSYLEVVRTGRSSSVDLWMCEITGRKDGGDGITKQYLKTVDLNQAMLEVTAIQSRNRSK